jgi:hypothetical protein
MKELYLDFDEKIDIEEFEKHLGHIASMTGTVLEIREVHPTRRGIHIIAAGQFDKAPETYWITCPSWPLGESSQRILHAMGHTPNCKCDPILSCQREFNAWEIVTMQLLLGSDPKREAFNFMRAHNLGDAPAFWHDRWNVLYAEKLGDSKYGEPEKRRIPRDITDTESNRS